MSVNPWFKFYAGEYLSDPKIASLNPQERSCWVTLLCLASISSTPGTIEYLTVDALMQKSGIVWDPYEPDEWEKTSSVLNKFERMKMITKSNEGVIEVVNWKKRQESSLTGAERTAKHRLNKGSNENVTEHVTKVTPEENREEENRDTSVANAPQEITEEREEAPKKVSTKKYPHHKEVFALWGKVPFAWLNNNTEKQAAENLYTERGLEEIANALKWYVDLQDREFCPQVSSPVKLDRKWDDFEKFVEKQEV